MFVMDLREKMPLIGTKKKTINGNVCYGSKEKNALIGTKNKTHKQQCVLWIYGRKMPLIGTKKNPINGNVCYGSRGKNVIDRNKKTP